MHKISRTYIANAGYKLAWYDGLLLDFTDAASGDPTHTIYNLVNQGGKTTFLALLFSCIRTKRDEFLQTLSNPGQRFEDYFDKDGMPATIAIEWKMPGDLANPTRTVVTGQIVVVRRSSEPVEAERWFFLMQGGSQLTLDDIPAPNLNCSPEQVFQSREEVVTWLHKTRTELGEQVFYYTQNQAEWAKALVAVGLDVELLKHQVDFNRKEGSMDEAFLSFKDEREFVRRFLILTMDATRADQVRETVAAHCRRLASRKPLQDALIQIGRFESVFLPFGTAARLHAEAMQAQSEVTNKIAAAVATLELRVQEQNAQKNAQEETARLQNDAADAADTRQIDSMKDGEAYKEEQLRRAEDSAQQALNDAEVALAKAQRYVRLVNAAELLTDIESKQFELDNLTQAIDNANGEVAPLRAEFRQRGALLREGLRLARKTEQDAAKEYTQHEEEAKEALSQLASAELAAKAAKEVAQKIRITAETSLAQARKRRSQLEVEGALQPGELAEIAIVRLLAAAEELQGTAAHQDDLATAADNEAQALSSRRATLMAEQATAEGNVTRLDEELQRGLAEREALASNMALCRAIGAELADPDSEVLEGWLQSYIQRLQEGVTQAELDYARLEEDAQSIRETGLAGRDAEVAKVVRALADHGVKRVQAYAQYLASVFPDGKRARELVESDPSRFFGVVVHTPEQLDRVNHLAPTLPPLTRPVVVSLATETPAPVDSDRLVLGPADDSLFNSAAAVQKAERIEPLLLASGNRRKQTREQLTDAQHAKQKLTEYLKNFGRAKLERLGAAVRQQREVVEQTCTALGTVAVRINDAGERARNARESAAKLRSQLSVLKNGVALVQDFLANHESHSAAWQSEVVAQAAEELRLAELLNGLMTQKAEEEEQIRDSHLKAAEHMREAQSLYEDIAKVPDHDREFDAEQALAAVPRSLVELRTLHHTAKEALEAAERQQAAPLLVRKQAVEQALLMAQARYMEIGAELPRSEVRALLNIVFSTERARAKHVVDAADSSKNRCLSEHGGAQTRLGDFRQKRTYAGHDVFDSANLSDEELATALDNARTAANAALEQARQTRSAALKAQQLAKDFAVYAGKFADAVKPLRGLVPGGITAPPAGNTFTNATVAGDEAAQLIELHRGAIRQAEQRRNECHGLFEKVRGIALSEEFAKTDLELAEVLRRNTFEEAVEDFERVENGIVQRRVCLEDELAKMDEDFERAVKELTMLVGEALSLLRRATETLKLPDYVPRVAGRTILTMHKGVFSLSQEARRERLSPLMNQLAADGNIPESGAALATYALMELANNKLGLKLLKVVEVVDEQYVPVEKLSKSGAESISMAMLLYFIIARLRYEQKAQSHSAEGGVLILDNPFSKATARPVWEIIIGLADAMNLQLVIATGIQEYETLSVFKRFIRLAKTHQNSATGRIYVGMADFNFKKEALSA